MADAAPAHVRDVEQAVDAAQVHERSEVGDVLHHAGADLALLELPDQLLLLLGARLLENLPAAHDYVAAALVQLDHPELELLSDELLQVGNLAQGDLRAGQEGIDTHDADDESALYALDHRSAQDGAVVIGGLDVRPDLVEVGLLLGDGHPPVGIFEALDEDVHLEALHYLLVLAELGDGNDALALVSDVDDDLVADLLEDRAGDDAPHLDLRGRQGLLVGFLQELPLLPGVLLTLHPLDFVLCEADDELLAFHCPSFHGRAAGPVASARLWIASMTSRETVA